MQAKFRERVQVGITPEGTVIERWASGSTKHDLHMSIARILIEAGAFPDLNVTTEPERVRGPLFEVYAKEWLETFKLNGLEEKTKSVYRSRMKSSIIPAFEGVHIEDITATSIQTWLNKLKDEDKAKSTVRDTYNLFKQVIAAAVDDKLLTENPTDTKKITNPAKKVYKRKPLTDEQWRDVVENIPNLKEVNDRRFMAILSYTCLRPGEVYGLQWEDFDFVNMQIDVERAISFADNLPIVKGPKTEAGVRTIPLPAPLLDYLAPYRETGYVIARENGDPYSEQTHKRAWQRIKRTINLFGMTPYNWRHTYATTMTHAGVDIDTVRAIMGHTDVRMTLHYSTTQPMHIKKAGEVMNDHFVQVANGLCPNCAPENAL